MSISSNLRGRLRALFKRPPPDPENEEMPFDPEWDELLSWAQVARSEVPGGGEHVEAEEQEWAAAIEDARRRSERTEEEEWAAAIGRAKQAPAARPAFNRKEWEERIDLARRPPRRAGQSGAGEGWSLRERLERLATRVSQSAAEPDSEERQWQAAIQRAKAGNS